MAVRKNILNLLKKYKTVIGSAGINVKEIYLFGSYAVGKSTSNSDIDIAVISDDFSGNRFKDGLSIARLREAIDLNIEPVTFRPQDFVDEDPLVAQIKRYGVRV